MQSSFEILAHCHSFEMTCTVQLNYLRISNYLGMLAAQLGRLGGKMSVSPEKILEKIDTSSVSFEEK